MGTDTATSQLPAELDVLVVGAGITGIGAAVRLRERLPHLTWAIVEAREAIGGTWDLFRYPGIRSDSDMFTLGYSFRPWTNPQAIADGPAIRQYIEDTADEHGVREHIHLGHRVVRADWSSAEARWTVTIERCSDAAQVEVRCRFLLGGTGYYRYEQGYLPQFEGLDEFRGTFIHAQHWPEDLDYAGKRVVVIGSGATAVTIVPAVAGTAARVTMLQRSPSYVLTVPRHDHSAMRLMRRFGTRRGYALARRKNTAIAGTLYGLCRRFPKLMRRLLLTHVRRRLPEGYDVERHFTPSYDPWDQRLCLVPSGDLFRAIRAGTADVVTDQVERFDADGIQLHNGERLDADIVVAATGLDILLFGGIALAIDGEPVDPNERVTWRGMMLSGVPNFAFGFGYTNASWTLRIDLVWDYLCKLLEHMEQVGANVFEPQSPPPGVETGPMIDLTSGYIQRAADRMPRQAKVGPWVVKQSYRHDKRVLRDGPLLDEGIVLRRHDAGVPAEDRSIVGLFS